MQAYINRRVPVDDGVTLATDVYTPDGPGPFPVVLVRTPYHRVGQQHVAPAFVNRGYAFAVQDCRGKYDSDGVFTPLIDEARDGRATLDWVADQRWCSGRIGLWGRSYPGIVQVPAAGGGHEALRCILPSVAPASFFKDWIRYDGCFASGNAIRWSLIHASCRNKPPNVHFTWPELDRLPDPAAIAGRVGFETPNLREWARHDRYDDFWARIDQTRMHPGIRVPGFHAGGWFDHLSRGQFDAYYNIRKHGATEAARTGQRLLIGPWGHRNTGNTGPDHRRYGDWEFGAEADLSVFTREMQCLDFWLKDLDHGYADRPPVEVFLMGANRWIGLDDWPPPGHEVQTWHLDSGGNAHMRIGDGTLRRDAPARSTGDTYTYDPSDPVPTRGGAIYWGFDVTGPVDQRPLLDRPDVLYYRSERLETAVAVVGEITLDLIVASDAVDTDFIVKLCVEEPSGAVTCLTNGSLRCRYRTSRSDPETLTPGERASLPIQLGHLAYVFPPDSRIGLTVTSSDFPRILPHANTMAAPWEDARPVIARNTVLHGPDARSCLKLPVLYL